MDNSKLITSAANPLIKKIKSLDQKKYRDEEKLFVVEGERHIAEALDAGWTADTIAFDTALKDKIKLPATKAHFVETTEELLSRMTGRDNTQGVIGVFQQRLHELPDVQNGLWVGLEDIRDPGNLGTVIRTAAAVGAEGILLIGSTCDPFSPEAIRASMGSFARVKIARAAVRSFADWRLAFKGRIVGTHVVEAQDYREIKYAKPMILMMGSEQNGLSDAMTALCDDLAKIPMPGGTESLNLAVSAGIMLYEISRGDI
jgi:TrmH family RNA methyltransferase